MQQLPVPHLGCNFLVTSRFKEKKKVSYQHKQKSKARNFDKTDAEPLEEFNVQPIGA